MTKRSPEPAPLATDDVPETLSMSEAARLIGKLTHGRPPHIATLHRWAAQGVTNPAGCRVFLETLKFGRRRVTTRDAVLRFASELAAPATGPANPTPATPHARHSTQSARSRRARVECTLEALRRI